ncbi:MAG: hypothetical protein Q8M44_04625, partial [bacterium]|nr:hypothetical protein [bacterium]
FSYASFDSISFTNFDLTLSTSLLFQFSFILKCISIASFGCISRIILFFEIAQNFLNNMSGTSLNSITICVDFWLRALPVLRYIGTHTKFQLFTSSFIATKVSVLLFGATSFSHKYHSYCQNTIFFS